MKEAGSSKVKIGGIVDVSTVDWPLKICNVVFFSGCNFRCPFCQNGRLVDPSYGKVLEVDEVIKLVLRSKPLIDGVVISGGECTLQAEGLIDLCRELKRKSLSVGIDTNGSIPNVIEELLKEQLVDRVAIDIKAPLDPKIYERVIGLMGQGEAIVSNIGKSLDLLLRSNIEVEARFLAVPGLTCNVDYVREVARRVRGVTRLVIQQFRPEAELLDPSLKSLKSPTRQELITMANAAIGEGLSNVYIRTREHGFEKVKR
ncbi:MAG: anaerobic ribonucleoside-triphosphate reductase activating protein [Candidatus Nezhaarchaeales archaeon]